MNEPYVTLRDSGPRNAWTDKFEDWRARAEAADAEVERLRTAYRTPLAIARERDEARALVKFLYDAWGEERIGTQMGPDTLERFRRVLAIEHEHRWRPVGMGKQPDHYECSEPGCTATTGHAS